MKTLVINGSPRKNGDTMTLVNEMVKYLQGEVKIIHTYYDNIRPCVDCRHCWTEKNCCINDDMQEVYKLLDEVDNVIMASPLYFSELTGQLLSFASRLQVFFARKFIQKDKEFKLKDKKGVLIITGGGSSKNCEHAVETANIILNEMNVASIGTICSIHTDKVPVKEDREALEKARKLAEQLN